MAWSWLQSKSGVSASGTTLAVTFGSNLSSGSKLIAITEISNATLATTNIKDSGTSTFFTKLTTVNGVSSVNTLEVWVLDTPSADAGTAQTITWTFSGTNNGAALLVQEVAGLATGTTTAACYDGTAGTATGTSSNPANLGAYSSTAANEYLLAIVADNGDSTQGGLYTTPSGYTVDTGHSAQNSDGEIWPFYKNSTGGTESPTSVANSSTTTGYSTVFVAFKLAGGAAAPVSLIVPWEQPWEPAYTRQFGPSRPFLAPPLAPIAGTTPVSDTDTGSGAEASSINATLPDTETGAGAEAGTIGLSNPETGTGTDTGVTIGLSGGETGTSSDTSGVDVLGSDTGAAADASSISATLSDTDTGSGAEASTVKVLAADTGSGADAGEKISLSNPDTGTGTDTGSQIGLSGGETGSGSDTSGVDVLASDTGSSAEANTLTANVPSAETGAGADASTSIGLSNPDTGSFADGNGSVAVLATDSDSWTGTDASTILDVVPASQETGSGAEASSITASVPSTDTGAGAEAGQIALSNPDIGTGTDTGSSIGLSGGETGSGSDTSGVDVLGSDTTAGADNSTSIGLSTSDTGGSSDSTFINATLTSSDTASGVDGGESIGTTNAPHDTDTGFFGDSEIFTVPSGAGTGESGGASSEAASLAIAQADSGTSAEAATVLITGSVFLADSDAAAGNEGKGVGAGPRNDVDAGSAADAQRISMPPTSDSDAGSFDDELQELHVWAALPPDPHPGGGYGVVFGRGKRHETLLMRADRLSLPLLKYAQMIRELEASGGMLLRLEDADSLAGQDVQDKTHRVELHLFLADQGASIIVQARASSNGTWLRPQLQLEGPGGAAELRGGLLIHPVHGYVTWTAPAAAGRWTARAALPGTGAVAEQGLTISPA